ncbi:hypothetical protein Corgl_0107 [Coriobacterium glomerans PW2]|uniref:Uncharacterized protein n=1 Tax=Coriobacterium glomerans (strain ATCC 49209 / DSM 20642 / JCM 10262 / PW2) TaxID=700015 RepID=F2N9X9_CORGP|nr:hypothetical protein Corgl_0107 [Coriobacterium glomerans PW2]
MSRLRGVRPLLRAISAVCLVLWFLLATPIVSWADDAGDGKSAGEINGSSVKPSHGDDVQDNTR